MSEPAEPFFSPTSSTRIWDLLNEIVTWVKSRLQRTGLIAIAAGTVKEIAAGPTTTWVPFPANRFTAAPVVTVTLASAAGAHTWDTPRVYGIGPTGFSLLTKNGAGADFHWIAVQK